jgi:hypothetical protein
MQVYALMQVKKGTLGPRLRRVEFDCTDVPLADSPKDNDGRPLCRQGMDPLQPVLRGSGHIKRLVDSLQIRFGGVVVDATGLEGNFVWELDMFDEDKGFSELGLKVEQVKTTVDVVVIDAVSMPTPN